MLKPAIKKNTIRWIERKLMYRIMLADDEGIVIDSVKFIIEKEFGNECVVEFAKTGISVATIMFPLIGVGFVLNFVFANYEGSVIKSILESCKNIISVLLGVVNVFSDIVSYIRLWAVGLAGAAIAQTVNEMAGPTLGGFLIFAGILLLVFGHGLNMILNVLSVIVHGVRLNTLEFSSHLGMSWSGFSYKPFAEK
jgi:V/A-type H+-transporting ATPase subunit I